MGWIHQRFEVVSLLNRLYRAGRLGRRFYAEYGHIAKNVAFHPDIKPRLDVYSPATGAGHPVCLFLHGGGWTQLRKEWFAAAAMVLVPEGMVVVIPDYTLYPDAGYEQMTYEVAAALSWTLENIARYGGDPRRVVISGHSAGSHLMALAVMDPRFLLAYGHQWTEVAGMLGVSGIYDLQVWYDFDQSRRPSIVPDLPAIMGGPAGFGKASPISYVRRDLPPILLIHGDQDAIVPWNSSAEFHAALRRAGAHSELQVYVGAGHNDILLEAAEEERAPIVVDIVRFCRDARLPT